MSFFALRKRAAVLALAALTLAACQPAAPAPEDLEDDGPLMEDTDNDDLDQDDDQDNDDALMEGSASSSSKPMVEAEVEIN